MEHRAICFVFLLINFSVITVYSQNQIEIDSVIGHPGRDAIRITYAQNDGVQVKSAGNMGINITTADNNGVNVVSADNYGIAAFGSNGNILRGDKGAGKADLILKAFNGEESGDDGTISSDPLYPGSDLFLEANDAIVAQINKNNDGNGNFFVWDGINTNLFQVKADGTVLVKGTTVHGSDRHAKENIEDLNYDEILERIKEMPVYQWRYKNQQREHIGPMAQDFYEAFGLGDDDTTIAAIDADGIALAAIKAQQEVLEKQLNQIKALEKEVAELKDLIAQIDQQ